MQQLKWHGMHDLEGCHATRAALWLLNLERHIVWAEAQHRATAGRLAFTGMQCTQTSPAAVLLVIEGICRAHTCTQTPSCSLHCSTSPRPCRGRSC